jgi:hypothetical protein
MLIIRDNNFIPLPIRQHSALTGVLLLTVSLFKAIVAVS